MKRISLFFLGIFIISISESYCYDEKITHPRISEEAIKKSNLDSYVKTFLGLPRGRETKCNGIEITELIKIGSINEDTPLPRAENHFFNPLNNEGMGDWYLIIWRGLSNKDWALGNFDCPGDGVSGTEDKSTECNDYSWKKARAEFYKAMTSKTQESRNDNFKKLYESLGRILHLIEDLGVPAHTRNDMKGHLNFTEIHFSDPDI